MQRSYESRLADIVVFGAGGQFGRLFTRRFRDAGIAVHGVDVVRDAAGITLRADEAEVIRRLQFTDAALLCIPEKSVLAELPFLARHLRRGALLIDIASVKSDVTAAAAEVLRGTAIEYLSIHPMFGPDLDFAGGNVVFIGPADTPRAGAFKALVESWHVTSHTMTAEQHDRATRITQAACHAAVLAFALTAASSGLDLATIRKVETPLSRALLALGARILSGDPSLYFTIQHNNGTAARDALVKQLNLIESLLSRSGEAVWDRQLKDAAAFFAGEMEEYSDLASAVLKLAISSAQS